MSKRGTPSFKPAPKARKPPLNSDTPSGLMLNKRELHTFKDIATENPDVEYLYLRENEFSAFDPYVTLDRLKVLDLSINNITKVDFLTTVPKLRHLYLTGNRIDSLEGIASMPTLETLCMSDNDITSFRGLDDLQSLRVLSLNFNSIASFEQFPYLPELHTLNLIGNPLAETKSYRKMAIAASSTTLQMMDTKPVTEEERTEVDFYRGKVVYCINEGMVVEGDQPEEQADSFLLKLQCDQWSDAKLALESVSLSPEDEKQNVLTEGEPVKLNICMRDRRPLTERRADIFHSRFLFPVAFKVHGEAQEVFVTGAMNRWGEPIPLERCEEDGEVSFQTTMYLPAGDYEYRYIVDGKEKVSEELATSKYDQGQCNIHHVQDAQNDTSDDEQTVLFIRWLRCNESNGFDIIEYENGLTYIPTQEDVSFCLRAEVLAYIDGQFSFLYFDISSPVQAGKPSCTKLEIIGNAAEGETLTVEVAYAGGSEGNSLLQWLRLDADGNEEPVAAEDPWVGYVVEVEDIGKRIVAEYTPIRADGEAGEKVTAETALITAGAPTCRELLIQGDRVEGVMLRADALYSGGFEGASLFQWFRHDPTTDQFFPIAGETNATYTPGVDDVNNILAVEYTPVSEQEVVGETARCVLEETILATEPGLKTLAITGRCEEQHVLMVEYDYIGGYYGVHHITWFAMDRAGKKRRIGRPNNAACTLTPDEVGSFVVVEFTPVRDDGLEGPTLSATTNEPVQAATVQLRSMALKASQDGVELREAVEGALIEVVADYLGGEPADPKVEWVRERPDGSADIIMEDATAYVAQMEDTSCTLRVTVTPLRADGVEGESKTRTIAVVAARAAPVYAAPVDITPATTLQDQMEAAATAATEEAAPAETEEAAPVQEDEPKVEEEEAPVEAQEEEAAPAEAEERHVDPTADVEVANPEEPAEPAGEEPKEE